MENKQVGYLLLGIAVLLIVIIFLYQNALQEIVVLSCGLDHGESCPMEQTINQQTYLALGIVGIIIIISGLLIFSKPNEKVIVKEVKVKEKRKHPSTKGLDEKEKHVIDILRQENGAVFQSALKEKLGIGKVGLTRLLDKLEAKQFIERKRRGMNNLVVLKD
jgi:uncharacterized membrane protein